MPREVWSVEIQADITTALGQLQQLRSAIMGMGTKGAAIKPTFDASGVTKGVNEMDKSLRKGRKRATTFIEGIKEDFGSFGRILASRIAFSIATTVQRVIVGALLLIPKAMGAAIKAGSEFEQAIRRTATVAAGGFGDIEGAMSKLGVTARQVGAETTFTAVEVASAMFELVSVGLTVVETQDAIAASAELAVAVQTDLATAIDITTQIMKAFGLNASELSDIGDKLTFAIDTTALNVSRLQAALRFAAPAAGALNVSFDDMLTVISKFVDVTKQGGISGRAFRFMISRLAKPTEEAIGVLDKLGLTTRQVNPKFNDLTDIMNLFARTTLDGTDALAVFGKRAGGTVAGAIDDVRISLATGVDSLNDFKEALTNAARLDLAAKQAKEFMDTLASQFRIFVSKVTELGLQIFDVIGPFVIVAVKGLNKFLDVLIAIAPQLKTFFKLLVAIVAVRIGSALLTHAGAMKRFVAQTIFGNKALKTHAALLVTTQGKTAAATGGLAQFGLGFGKLSKVLSKIVPFVKKFAGKAGVLGLITLMIEWARRSVVIQHALTGIGRLLSMVAQSILSFLVPGAELKQWFTDVVELVGLFIDRGLDFFIASLIDGFGWLVDKVAEFAEWLGVVDEDDNVFRSVAANASHTADAMRRMSEAQAIATEEAERQEKAQLSLKESLKQVVRTADDFRKMEVAIVNSYNNMIEAGESQEDAINLLAPALLELFNSAELVDGEYSNSLLPIMKLAEIQLGLVGDETDALAERMERLADAFSATFGTNPEETTEGLLELLDALSVVKDTTGELSSDQLVAAREKLEELRDAAEEAGIAGRQDLAAGFALATAVINSLTADVQMVAPAAVNAAESIGLIPAAVVNLSTTVLPTFQGIQNSIQGIEDGITEAQKLMALDLAPPGALDAVKGDFLKLAESIALAKDESIETRQRFMAMATGFDFVREEGESFLEFAERVAEAGEEAKGPWEDFFKGIREGAGKAFADALIKGQGFAKAFTTLGRSLVVSFGSTVSQGFQEAFAAGFKKTEDDSRGFFGRLGGSFSDGFGAIGDMFKGGDFFGDLLSGAFSGLLSGGISAGIDLAMKGLGKLAGALKNLFGGTTAEKELKKLGLTISEELTKKIEEAKDALGDYGAAIRTNLAGIMQEEGVKSIADFNKFLGMNRDLLIDMEKGTISSSEAMESMGESMTELIKAAVDLNSPAAFGGVITNLADVIHRTTLTGASMVAASDATKLLGEQFPALVEASKEFGLAGKAGLRQIIDGAREVGLAVEEIDSFVKEKAGTIVSSIQKLVGSGLELTASQVAFAARSMSVAFAEMRAAGMSVPEIINQMGDSLGAIRKRANELGVELPKSFRLIAGLGPLFQNEFVKPQLEGLDAVTSAFGALIELGLRPTQEDFQALTETAFQAFTTMQEQGASGKQALLAISPTLAMIRDNAIQFGFAIDANTQSLIDQAVESGVLGEAQMSTTEVMQTGFENVGNAINRLIETMGGVPVALQGFAKEMATTGSSMVDDITATGTAIKTEIVGGIDGAMMKLSGFGSMSAEQMAQFAAASEAAVQSSLDDFKFLQKELVGNTIIKDIARMGSEFMEDWGDNTHQVVMNVGTDFQGLKDETIGTPGVPGSGTMNQIKTGILTRPPLPKVAALTPQMQEQMNLKKALQTKEAQKINMRVDIGGREVKNLIVETVADESRDGRVVVDTNSVRETGR